MPGNIFHFAYNESLKKKESKNQSSNIDWKSRYEVEQKETQTDSNTLFSKLLILIEQDFFLDILN